MKKIVTIILALALIASVAVGLVACNDAEIKDSNEVEIPALANMDVVDYSNTTIPADFKIGVICLHGEESTYDLNFINSAKAAAKALGLKDDQLIIQTNVSEDPGECSKAAKDLIDNKNCKAIFADSFGHQFDMVELAALYPNVQFCHATGDNAKAANLPNYFNAFASIYEGRFLAGIAAGLKLYEINKGKDADKQNYQMGYVGAWTYAEVISGYTSFFLGAKYALNEKEAGLGDKLTMKVKFTGSWYNVTAEKNAANALIAAGCALISQHADSLGAPSACEAAGIPNVSYNGSTIEACPNTFIVSSRIDWTPYLTHIIAMAATGGEITPEYVGTLNNGAVALTKVNGDVMAEGTIEAIVAARAKLVAKTLYVFDTATFKVKGQTITEKIVNGKNVIENGVFKESDPTVRSAPYFDYDEIDGITCLNRVYDTNKETGEPEFIE